MTTVNLQASPREWTLVNELRNRVNIAIVATGRDYLSVSHPLVQAKDMIDHWLYEYDYGRCDFWDYLFLKQAVDAILYGDRLDGNEAIDDD